jgi:putative transposase
MPWSLERFQEARCLHFITFSCYHRKPLLSSSARDIFEHTLERTRQWYGFCISAYVVMPEHVHLLVTEPERAKLSVALQMLKQNVANEVKSQLPHPVAKSATRMGHPRAEFHFWQKRYYDFNVWSEDRLAEKLAYIHANPVSRGLVEHPEDWPWSSFRHYVSGVEGVVEIESQWTARKREQLGIVPEIIIRKSG